MEVFKVDEKDKKESLKFFAQIENFDLTIYEKTNNVCKILDENREIFQPEFIEDLIYILDKLTHEQLNPAQLSACENLIERQKYENQRAKDERYEKRIEFLESELETYKKIVDEKNKELNEENLECSKLAVENNDLKEKLKTSEKIAEKLAGVTYDYANLGIVINCPAEYDGKVDLRKCKQNHIERNCIQCIIDWARNEVEK